MKRATENLKHARQMYIAIAGSCSKDNQYLEYLGLEVLKARAIVDMKWYLR